MFITSYQSVREFMRNELSYLLGSLYKIEHFKKLEDFSSQDDLFIMSYEGVGEFVSFVSVFCPPE